jgi:OmpA-OmpF porin, OOP family
MIKLSGFSVLLGLLAASALGCGSSPPPAPAHATTAGPVDPKNVAPGTEDDLDSDGVPNSEDKCPNQKEDGLPPNPKDGCPKT